MGGALVGYCHANFKNENLIGINLSGSDLSGANLENANLCEASLSGVNLENANLENANLSGANLEGANLGRANLKNANLCGVDITSTFLVSAVLKGVIIDENTKLDDKTYLIWEIVNQGAVGRNLIGVDLTGACLDYADLREANLSDAKLGYFSDKNEPERPYRCSLRAVNLAEANLKNTEFRKANLENATLEKANLEGANLSEANLGNAKLNGAKLNDADLTKAKLINTKFGKATLYKAVLCEAKLSGSSWLKADLRKSDLRKTSLNSASTLREAYYDEETRFPDGFEPKNQKMVFRTEDYEYIDFLNSLLTLKIKKDKSPPPRPGQDEFRDALIKIYGAKCIITGCHVEKAIEAAHIIPYNGLHSHHLANGLLLRVDLHRLFDNHLLTIHPETRKVLIAPELMSSYKEILGKEIEVCLSGEDAIKQQYILKYHYQLCSWVNNLIDQ